MIADDSMTTGKRGGFRGTITVDQRAVSSLCQQLVDMGDRQGLAPGEKLLDGSDALQVFVDNLMEKSCR